MPLTGGTLSGQLTAKQFNGPLNGNATSATNADKVDNYHASQLWRSDGATWNGGANISCAGTNVEFSFDVNDTANNGNTYWHVWSVNLGQSMIAAYPKSGNVNIPYHLYVGGYNHTSYGISANSLIVNGAAVFNTTITGNISGNVKTSNCPQGFPDQNYNQTWGMQNGQYVTGWGINGCELAFRQNCPTNGQLSLILDGRVYTGEGTYLCLDISNVAISVYTKTTTANEITTSDFIGFPYNGFSGTPRINVTPHTSNPKNIYAVGLGSNQQKPTAKGFYITCFRTSSVSTAFDWITIWYS